MNGYDHRVSSQEEILEVQTDILFLLCLYLRAAVVAWHDHVDLAAASVDADQPVLLVVLLLLLQVLVFHEGLVHLVKGKLELKVEDVSRDQVGHLDGHVAFVVVEELARVVRLQNFVHRDVDELADDGSVLGQVSVEAAEELVFEDEVGVEEHGEHRLVADVDHQSIGLQLASLFILEVDGWRVVLHLRHRLLLICSTACRRDEPFAVREVVGSNNKTMKCLGNKGEGILRIDPAEVGLPLNILSLLRYLDVLLIFLLLFFVSGIPLLEAHSDERCAFYDFYYVIYTFFVRKCEKFGNFTM